jgi:hypothetical protein
MSRVKICVSIFEIYQLTESGPLDEDGASDELSLFRD